MARVYQFRRDPEREPVALHDRAMDDLRFIRETMERSEAFTAVPGFGTVAIGLMALLATPLAAMQPTLRGWVGVWIMVALISVPVAGLSMAWKSRHAGVPLFTGSGRKFVLNFIPPIIAGGILTVALFGAGQAPMLHSVWLLLYGVAVMSAGAFSVPLVPLEGLMFMALGVVSLVVPPEARDILMAVGFGGLHIVFGILIARRHGG